MEKREGGGRDRRSGAGRKAGVRQGGKEGKKERMEGGRKEGVNRDPNQPAVIFQGPAKFVPYQVS